MDALDYMSQNSTEYGMGKSVERFTTSMAITVLSSVPDTFSHLVESVKSGVFVWYIDS